MTPGLHKMGDDERQRKQEERKGRERGEGGGGAGEGEGSFHMFLKPCRRTAYDKTVIDSW